MVGAVLALLTSHVTVQAATAFVNLTGTQQTIRGFGGASVWLGALSDSQMNTLYGNASATQLGFSILRIRISPDGSSQWANEVSNAQKAVARGAIVMASPWSPPASMKTNNSTVGGSLKTSQYAAYANYLNSFKTHLSDRGVSLYAISMQNEPDISVTYESCDWTTTQLLNFAKNNAGAITMKVMMAESFNFNQTKTDPILNDAAAAANVDIVAGHIYGGGLSKYALAFNKGKEVWMTEHLDTSTTWSGALATAKEIHDCMTVANYSAYLWFYLRRSYGPIDESSAITKRGYVMGHYAKFVRPGYIRVNATYNPSTGVYVSAYKGSKAVIVAINTGTAAVNQTFTVQNGTVASVTPWRTTSGMSMVALSSITLSGGSFTTSLPAQSITTFVQK